eukprot:11673621-Alexandrium_andersonii.AAC.1
MNWYAVLVLVPVGLEVTPPRPTPPGRCPSRACSWKGALDHIQALLGEAGGRGPVATRLIQGVPTA